MGINVLKVQIAVSMQLQMALHDPSRGIRFLSSETIFHFLKTKKKLCTSSAMRVYNFKKVG